MNTAVLWLLRGLAVLAVVGAIIFGYSMWRGSVLKEGRALGNSEVQAKWDADKILQQKTTAELVAKARREEQEKAAQAAKDERVTYANEKIQAAATARAAGVVSGMSRNIASLNADALKRGLPTVSSCPGEFVRERDAGILARQLLDSCSSRYQELAVTADGLALKLDTSLRYIAIVAPAAAP